MRSEALVFTFGSRARYHGESAALGVHVFGLSTQDLALTRYPAFPPDKHAERVHAWLAQHPT